MNVFATTARIGMGAEQEKALVDRFEEAVRGFEAAALNSNVVGDVVDVVAGLR